MWDEKDCPKCNNEIAINLPRCNSKTICPFCKANIVIDYDFIYMEEQSDEWDLYELRSVSEEEYKQYNGQEVLSVNIKVLFTGE